MSVSKAQRKWFEQYQIAKAMNARKVSRGIVARERI